MLSLKKKGVVGRTVTFDDVELRAGVLGNNGFRSKDPMSLISGDRTGHKEDIASNIEFYIHPTKLKGLNIMFGGAHSWRDRTGRDGEYREQVNNNSRKYMGYFDSSYSTRYIDFGYLGYFSSHSPMAIDYFFNGTFSQAAWTRIKPVTGLSIEIEGTHELPTKYFDETKENDTNNWAVLRTIEKGYDFFAHAAFLAGITYSIPDFITAGIQTSMAGTMFKGNLAAGDSRFAGWDDADGRVNGVENFGRRAVPYYYADRGSQINTTVNFSVKPFKTELLTIGYKHETVVGKLDGNMDKNYENGKNPGGKQEDKFQIDNIFRPSLTSKFSNIELNAGTAFSVTVYQDEFMSIDGKKSSYEPGVYFTFNKFTLGASFDQISPVLKKAGLDYTLEFEYYPGFYTNDTTRETWDALKNNIRVKNFYNQLMATFDFAHDITVGAGIIVRAYSGSQNDTDPDAILYKNISLSDKAAQGLGYVDSRQYIQKANMVKDYYNAGFAFQFKYKLPVDSIKNPLIFANIGLAWDPFTDDNDTRDVNSDDEASTKFQRNKWNFNQSHSRETSVIAVGIQWEF